MKSLSFLILMLVITLAGKAQVQQPMPFKLTESTVVKDSAGVALPYLTWKEMLASGKYMLRSKPMEGGTPEFVVTKMSDSQFNKNREAYKPRESEYFTTGQPFKPFKERDMNGQKWDIKALAGKVVVLNFWFINCAPCRMEIPELNKLVEKYTGSDVVFIAIALDARYDLKEFLKATPFNYHIIDAGRFVANNYNIKSYPTNVIIDRQGKVKFHTSGYGPNTPYWIDKEIKAALDGPM